MVLPDQSGDCGPFYEQKKGQREGLSLVCVASIPGSSLHTVAGFKFSFLLITEDLGAIGVEIEASWFCSLKYPQGLK